jgi:hypothetical protein
MQRTAGGVVLPTLFANIGTNFMMILKVFPLKNLAIK